MQTPEGKVKDKVRKVLRAHDAYYHMPVQNGMGKMTLDFIGHHYGIFFAIETKAPGKKPTTRQLLTIGEIEAKGGKVFVIDGDTTELNNWLEMVTHARTRKKKDTGEGRCDAPSETTTAPDAETGRDD